jgi:[ribosomal protein S5]-alanine N-acetyltransferase
VWVAPQFRGRGYASSALTLAAGWLFAACGLERLALLTETDNEPMLRVAAAAGFVREGVLRSHTRERGRRVDGVILSLLPGDPRGAR